MTVFGVNSEYEALSSVLLYQPGAEVGNHPHPADIQQLRPIDHPTLSREFESYRACLEGRAVQVRLIDPAPLNEDRDYRFNMMYCRDLFFMTPFGAILAGMANGTRRFEPLYAARALESAGCPILHRVAGGGRFEGADALWLHEGLVMVGVGNRTNREGYRQIAEALRPYGIGCVPVESSQRRTQHLLGSVQIVDRDLAMVRHEITDLSVMRLLGEQGFTLVEVPENDEVQNRQAMNIVTVAPRSIMMTAACPETKALFLQAGLHIAAELEISQLINGAGGLACATGIVGRNRGAQRRFCADPPCTPEQVTAVSKGRVQ